ncbi:phage tail protein, partial [Stenotrophomonas maltophilia group sp. RNC7]|uniref:phage tail protein n=1 Tax=Stenotrophomonas maltophilia group sp. RNC7 TaxID=3071467 RepID=UPI0027DEBA7C
FMLPATSEKIVELTPECEIYAGGRVYILRKDDAMDTVRDDKNAVWTKVMAVEKWYELDTSYVEPSISNDPTARPPADLAVIIVGGGSNLSGGLYPTGTAAHALYAILQGSGWTMGTIDVTGIRDLEGEKVSRLELIKMIQDIWGGYLLFDSVNKIIHLRDAGKWQPYTGFQVRYKKNLKHITRTQSNEIITRLYPFGHDDLDIGAVNGGKKYITNHSYTSREYVGIYKNQDIYSQAELLEKAQAELKLICRPRYLYKIKLLDVRILPDYEHEEFALGDMVDITDPDVAPDRPRARIIRHKYNLFKPWECELDIGDPEERLIEQLKASFNTTGFVDGKFNGSGKFSGHSLEYESV